MSDYMAGYTNNYMTLLDLLHGFLHVTLHDITVYYMFSALVTQILHVQLHDWLHD